jgi:hypothetical protein
MKTVFSFLIISLTVSSYALCQIKLFFDTSKVVNGNGVALLQSTSGKNFGFETYKNGHLEGKYYNVDTNAEYALKGELGYKPTCVNYLPGVKVTMLTNDNDTLIMLLESSLFKELIPTWAGKIIDTTFSLVPERANMQPDLDIGISDNPAVVPVGRWQLLDLKRNYVWEQFNFDDCGNTLSITYFKPDGAILSKHRFKPKNNKKKNW